jgi:hypothetical protein
MKRLIFLRPIDPNPKDTKIKKSELSALEATARLNAIKDFKKQTQSLPIKVLKENPNDPSVIIEFANNKEDEMYEALRVLPVVDVIDTIIGNYTVK